MVLEFILLQLLVKVFGESGEELKYILQKANERDAINLNFGGEIEEKVLTDIVIKIAKKESFVVIMFENEDQNVMNLSHCEDITPSIRVEHSNVFTISAHDRDGNWNLASFNNWIIINNIGNEYLINCYTSIDGSAPEENIISLYKDN